MVIAYIVVIFIALAVIAYVWADEKEKPEGYKREITLGEMLSVVNFYFHFEHATPYEREVLGALVEKLEEEMDERDKMDA